MVKPTKDLASWIYFCVCAKTKKNCPNLCEIQYSQTGKSNEVYFWHLSYFIWLKTKFLWSHPFIRLFLLNQQLQQYTPVTINRPEGNKIQIYQYPADFTPFFFFNIPRHNQYWKAFIQILHKQLKDRCQVQMLQWSPRQSKNT